MAKSKKSRIYKTPKKLWTKCLKMVEVLQKLSTHLSDRYQECVDLVEQYINIKSLEDTQVYSNSSTIRTLIPTEGPNKALVGIGSYFSATITTTVIVRKSSNKITVLSQSTRGHIDLFPDIKAITNATLVINRTKIDSSTLKHMPSITSGNHISLGQTELIIPTGMTGEIKVNTETFWTISHPTGSYPPIEQNVIVKIKNDNVV